MSGADTPRGRDGHRVPTTLSAPGGSSQTAARVRRSRHGRRHPWARVTGDGRSRPSATPSPRARRAALRPSRCSSTAACASTSRHRPRPCRRDGPLPTRHLLLSAVADLERVVDGRDVGPRRRRGRRPRAAAAHGQPGAAARAARPPDERRRPEQPSSTPPWPPARRRRRVQVPPAPRHPRAPATSTAAAQARPHPQGARRPARLARARRLGRPHRRRPTDTRELLAAAYGQRLAGAVLLGREVAPCRRRAPRGPRSSRAPSPSSMPSRSSPRRAPATSGRRPRRRSRPWSGSRVSVSGTELDDPRRLGAALPGHHTRRGPPARDRDPLVRGGCGHRGRGSAARTPPRSRTSRAGAPTSRPSPSTGTCP